MVTARFPHVTDVSEVSEVASPAHIVGGIDVRTYKRLNALALSAPAGLRLFQRTTPLIPPDVSRLRMYSDETLKKGERLRLEIFPGGRSRGGGSFTVLVEVAWVMSYPDPSRASFEVGLDVKGLARADAEKLATVLG